MTARRVIRVRVQCISACGENVEHDTDMIKKLIKDILQHTGVMQVATLSEGRPRVATVWFSYDANLNLYFMSRGDREHSRDIGKDKRIAGSIVDPRHAKPGNAVRGLSFQGVAIEAKGAELDKAYDQYCKRFPIISERVSLPDMRSGKAILRMYKISPENFVLFDEVDFVEQPSHELRL